MLRSCEGCSVTDWLLARLQEASCGTACGVHRGAAIAPTDEFLFNKASVLALETPDSNDG